METFKFTYDFLSAWWCKYSTILYHFWVFAMLKNIVTLKSRSRNVDGNNATRQKVTCESEFLLALSHSVWLHSEVSCGRCNVTTDQRQLQHTTRVRVQFCRVHHLHWGRRHRLQEAQSPVPAVCRWHTGVQCMDALIQDIDQAWYTLQHCVTDISSWCSSRRLQLNTDNTKLIWFGSRVSSCRKFLGVTLSYSLTPASSNRSK